MSMYVETDKPKTLAMATQPLYYMYANFHAFKDGIPRYMEITTEETLEIAYKVYYKLQDDINKLGE
ncbi:hypothetical protein VPLG_00168 [Vibrio phage eugene 12A10]|uniref:hypothetical protein n=1 Tax=Vibrio phage eugene 12A10 TaxID=573172 RepID=UPI000351DE52|nr:hypothetical protein VPLG_00168 [Vibrio phage eugene 12A10]AGN51607.1 hypothetical protein VPLG_00168 [Vibrio phage eugene 12A10]